MHVMPLHTDSVRHSIFFTLCISQHVVVINPDFFIQDRKYRDMSEALRIWDLRSGICRHGGTCPFGNELPSITSTVRSFHYSHRTMPRSWVSEYFEYLLTNSAGAWMQGNISEAPVTRSEIVKAVSECIAIAMTERDEPVVPELEKVLQRLHSQHPAHNGPLQHVVSERSSKNHTGSQMYSCHIGEIVDVQVCLCTPLRRTRVRGAPLSLWCWRCPEYEAAWSGNVRGLQKPFRYRAPAVYDSC